MKNPNPIHIKVYRRKYQGKPAATYSARIRIRHEGKVDTHRISTGCTSEADAYSEARKQADSLHEKMMARSYGFTPEQKVIAATPMRELIQEFIASKTGKPAYLAGVKFHIETITDAIPAKQIADLADADRIRRTLETIATQRKLGHRTWNAWRQSGSDFCNWLGKFKGLARNPFTFIDTRDIRSDPRHLRRPWTLLEFRRVLEEAELAKDLHSQSLFALALFTGWRASTVRALATDDVQLLSDGIVVSVPATDVKDKEARVATILDPKAVGIIRQHLATVPIGRRLFAVDASHTSEVTKHYMALAKARWVTEAKEAKERAERERSDTLTYENRRHEFADFAALRMTWNHLQRLAGTDLRIRQELLGHSDPKLTSLTYDRVQTEEGKVAAKASASWLTIDARTA